MNTAEAGRTVTAMNPPAKTEPSLTEINGEKLTSEQQSYLSGWFAGLRDRGFGFSDVATTAAAATPAPGAADLSSLILEERVKKELHPLDAYPLLLEHASTQQAPDRENTFRFKWHGLFYLTPVKEAFMARLRVPGGVLRGFQLREIARIAKELTSGYIQITTRANLQIRLIQVKDTPEFLRQIQHTGLHTRGAGADNIRNLTASPTSGLDPYELIETIPIAQQRRVRRRGAGELGRGDQRHRGEGGAAGTGGGGFGARSLFSRETGRRHRPQGHRGGPRRPGSPRANPQSRGGPHPRLRRQREPNRPQESQAETSPGILVA
jgi:hypothetical protein